MKYLLFLSLLLACAASQSSNNNMSSTDSPLGTFSLSLAVADIQASYDFYTQLGFSPVPQGGDLAQKWIILSNGSTKIGLFEGMFPQNTLTFNPTDARPLHRELQSAGVAMLMSNGMDQEEGPCSFMISDPDGNPILIDQH